MSLFPALFNIYLNWIIQDFETIKFDKAFAEDIVTGIETLTKQTAFAREWTMARQTQTTIKSKQIGAWGYEREVEP
jgi:hypothetical protein